MTSNTSKIKRKVVEWTNQSTNASERLTDLEAFRVTHIRLKISDKTEVTQAGSGFPLNSYLSYRRC